MRLNEKEITTIVQKIFRTWKFEKLMTPKDSEGKILLLLEQIITENLQEEIKLNQEVQKMVDQILDQSSENVDQRKLFQMIKKQLIKDRKLVI